MGLTSAEHYLDLIDAVIYGEVFACAVTFEELHRYCLVRVTREALAARLADPILSRVVAERDGYYFLAGRDDLVGARMERRRRAQALRRRALRVARILQYAPFVRGLLLTGSVAADDASEEADLDMLVVVAGRRLALVFAILAPISRLVSRRVFCPNYYLSEDHLPMRRRNYYVAREIIQAVDVAGPSGMLWHNNSWAADCFPNALPDALPAGHLPGGHSLQRLLELPFRGGWGDRLEHRAQRLALARLAAHYGRHRNVVPATVIKCLESDEELRFHGNPQVADMLERYVERRAEIARIIRSLLDQNPGAAEVLPS